MAEDLPANLDDGELWLPSDVIRAVGVCRHHHHRLPGRLAAADDLALKLASLGLLDHRRAIPTVKHFKDFPRHPEVQFQGQRRPVSWLLPVNGGYKAPIGRRVAAVTAADVVATAGGTGSFYPVSRAVHKFHPGLPVDAQVDVFRLERARVLQRQRQQQGHELNRFVPARAAGSGRETGGTGVFLPRVFSVDPKKKPLSLKGGSAQFQQAMWNPMSGKQVEKFLPSSEMGLPHDWTY